MGLLDWLKGKPPAPAAAKPGAPAKPATAAPSATTAKPPVTPVAPTTVKPPVTPVTPVAPTAVHSPVTPVTPVTATTVKPPVTPVTPVVGQASTTTARPATPVTPVAPAVTPVTAAAQQTTAVRPPQPATSTTYTAPAAPAATSTTAVPHTAPAPVIAPTGELQVVIGTSPVQFTTGKPYLEGFNVMVPIRELADHLGAKTAWDDKTRTATLSKDDDKVEITIGSTTAKVNGKPVPTGTPPVVRQDRIYMPIQFMAEALEASYSYDGAKKIAMIS